MEIRRADFAGSWYPGNEKDCRRTIEEFSSSGIPCPGDSGEAFGGIVPHAGWMFSGKIACNVIKCLKCDQEPDTCIIFGRHLHPGDDNFIMTRGAWQTPFGDLKIDGEMAGRLSKAFNFIEETPRSYGQDNTIELQLPFIKYFFPKIMILPLGLPPRDTSLDIARKVAEIAMDLGRKTIVLGSTDLTHYGYNYGYTPKGVGEDAVTWVKEHNDKRVVDLMLTMDGKAVIEESLRNHNACCSGAAGAAIEATKKLGAKRAVRIVYATSYDVRPDHSFVGYAGILFCS